MNKKELTTWTVSKLKQEAKMLWGQIYISDCYGVNDMILLGWISEELNKRGYEFKESSRISIGKI